MNEEPSSIDSLFLDLRRDYDNAWRHFKDVFEYSVFGDITGQTKIGDFSC